MYETLIYLSMIHGPPEARTRTGTVFKVKIPTPAASSSQKEPQILAQIPTIIVIPLNQNGNCIQLMKWTTDFKLNHPPQTHGRPLLILFYLL